MKIAFFKSRWKNENGMRVSVLKEIVYWDGNCRVEDHDLSIRLLKRSFWIGFTSDIKTYDERPIMRALFFKQRVGWVRVNFKF